MSLSPVGQGKSKSPNDPLPRTSPFQPGTVAEPIDLACICRVRSPAYRCVGNAKYDALLTPAKELHRVAAVQVFPCPGLWQMQPPLALGRYRLKPRTTDIQIARGIG